MTSKYEVAAHETVPIVRSIIAKELMEKYKMKEMEVAGYLDVAQAAVSKYVREKYSEKLKGKVDEIEAEVEKNRELIDTYIKNIAEGRKEYVGVCICTICSAVNDFFCKFSLSDKEEGAARTTG